MRDGAARVDPPVRRAIAQAARNIALVAARQIPKHFDVDVVPGVTIEQRVEPLARVGCYVPGGRFPLPSSLLMTAVPARVAGVRDVFVVLPAPGAGGDGRGARGRRHPPVSRRRRARDRGARLRHADDSARRQDRRARQPLRRGGEGARQPRLRDRLLRRPDRDRHRRRRRAAGLDRRRPGRAGRARSRRARDLRSPGAARLPSGWRRRSPGAAEGGRSSGDRSPATAR